MNPAARLHLLMVIAVLCAWLFITDAQAQAPSTWTRQFGTPGSDAVTSVVVDRDLVYVTGSTEGTLPGQTSAGGHDGFVRLYDSETGRVQWDVQFGSSGSDVVNSIALERDAQGFSYMYLAGVTNGTLPGRISAGGSDGFVRLYDSETGRVQWGEIWTFQLGTREFDTVTSVAIDPTGLYVAGWTDGTLPDQTSAGGSDGFVRKYDRNGIGLWTVQFGTADEDIVTSMHVHSSGVYVAGYSTGSHSAGGRDSFVRNFAWDGTELRAIEFNSEISDQITSMAVDPITKAVFVAGQVEGIENFDGFVRRYDQDGTLRWERRIFTPEYDTVTSIAVASDIGSLYVAGTTKGALLPDQTNAGADDGFVRLYDLRGNELGTTQFGTSAVDHVASIAVASDIGSLDVTELYIAGFTSGTLPGQTSARGSDAYVVRGFGWESN